MKKRFGKKLAIHSETLQKLESKNLKKADGGVIDVGDVLPSWNSDCFWGTCGDNSCAGFCTLARC